MSDFDDQFDELGEDFGIINTPSFIRSKYRELNDQWVALIAPYRGIGTGDKVPPQLLINNYRGWQREYKVFEDSWFNTLFAAGAISIWKNQALIYTRTYDYLAQMRNLNAGANQELTPDPSASGAIRLILPPEQSGQPSSFNLPGSSSGGGTLFEGINLNLGTIAVLSIAGLFAYSAFFRLREGRKR